MSKAPFEQNYPNFVPGYKTHTVEHHAIDAAGNIGPASEFKATVLPGARAGVHDDADRRAGRLRRRRLTASRASTARPSAAT